MTRRLVSPAVLLLALLCLGLPFIAVSCDSSVASVSAEYSGWDLVAGGTPDIDPAPRREPDQRGEIPAQPAAILFVFLAIAAIVMTRTRPLDLRTLGSAVCAGGAAVVLVVNQFRVHQGFAGEVERQGFTSDMVQTRFGFWLTLLLVLAATAHDVVAYARRNSPSQQPQRQE